MEEQMEVQIVKHKEEELLDKFKEAKLDHNCLDKLVEEPKK
jgi:hypothetical protein